VAAPDSLRPIFSRRPPGSFATAASVRRSSWFPVAKPNTFRTLPWKLDVGLEVDRDSLRCAPLTQRMPTPDMTEFFDFTNPIAAHLSLRFVQTDCTSYVHAASQRYRERPRGLVKSKNPSCRWRWHRAGQRRHTVSESDQPPDRSHSRECANVVRLVRRGNQDDGVRNPLVAKSPCGRLLEDWASGVWAATAMGGTCVGSHRLVVIRIKTKILGSGHERVDDSSWYWRPVLHSTP